MKNPLSRRYTRALKAEFAKYLCIFLFMLLSIGLISGFLVADRSMLVAYENSFEDYTVEDGHFRTARPLSDAQRAKIEALGVDLYDLPYVDLPADNGSTVRLYPWREEVNRLCLMSGAQPAGTGEIAVDRMWADNNGLHVGDALTVNGQALRISALVAFSDYSALFESNDDAMFDSVRFTVAAGTPELFEALSDGAARANYAWLYQAGRPESDRAAIDAAKPLAMKINAIAALEDFVPQPLNQAIRFTGNDMGSDRSMMLTLLYILMAIMAFVFAMTARSTIQRESAVIGTLRASGFTRSELVRHYILLPILVTLAAALAGNVLGYTYFKYVCADMYYNSYSLPTYITVWSGEAFVLTTVVPFLLMLAINWVILRRTLSLSPIRFLRHELRGGRRGRAIRLNEKIPFLRRFRLRVMLQNKGSMATLLVGILFANVILYFGLMLPVILDDYEADVLASMPANYQVLLSMPDEEEGLAALGASLMRLTAVTRTPGAEACAVTALQTPAAPGRMQENITLYGLKADSAYMDVPFEEGAPLDSVVVSEGFADKFHLKAGDSFTLDALYSDERYTFTVAGTYHYPAALSIFLPIEHFNEVFGHRADYFNAYLSDEPIEDINPSLIATVIDADALTKLSRQLEVSMGSMMGVVDGFCVVMFLILMYLLTKLIIEKNAQSISMVKILGGTNGEIAGLYLAAVAVIAGLSVIVTIPLAHLLVKWLVRVMMASEMTGWLTLNANYAVWGEMAVMGLLSFAAVAALEYRRILRIPMDAALKHME